MKRYNIAVIEDSELWRYLIRHEIEKHPDFRITLTSDWSEDFFTDSRISQIDLVMLDIHTPGVQAIGFARKVKQLLPQTPLVVFTSSNNTSDIALFNMIGVKGYIYKSRILELNRILCNIMGINISKGTFRHHPLSNEDISLIELVCEKLTNGEIADRLHRSEKLVEKRLKMLTEKLGIQNNKLSIFEFAVENGYKKI